MEGISRNREECCPRLLDLIHNDRDWIVKESERNFGGVAEEKKLELKLGPPGEESWFSNENNNEKDDQLSPSFGCFSSLVSKTHNINNNKNQNHKLSSMETQQVGSIFSSSSWYSGSSPSPSNFHKTQQQFQQHNNKPSYLQFQSIPQDLSAVAKESSLIFSTKVVLELQKNHTEKKTCFPTSVSVPANTAATNTSQKRTAPAPVVGWPPIRSFRKKLSSISSSKPASESQNGVLPKEGSVKKQENCRKNLFVKINMDGIPIGRKVDLGAYDSYEKLSSAVDELFRSLLAAQKNTYASGSQNKTVDVEAITGLLDGTGEYTLVYEDNEGDRMLVGDVPWHMFASTVKRLRVLKSSELSALRLGSSKQEKTPLETTVM